LAKVKGGSMKLIELTQGYFTKVDDADYASLSNRSWHVHKKRGLLYAHHTSHVNGISVNESMHRTLLGVNDSSVQVDHIDGDGLNNQRYNLRKATHSQNQHNRKRRRDGVSSYKGVGVHSSGLWRARIVVDSKEVHLGYFKQEKDAARAYNEAAKVHFGEFARINVLS